MDTFSFTFAGYRAYRSEENYSSTNARDYERRRKPVDPTAPAITPALLDWLRSLPVSHRPKNLILKFPRIANILADAANRPAAIDRLLNEYMLDDRGGRKGFPFDVLQEMATLREYYRAISSRR